MTHKKSYGHYLRYDKFYNTCTLVRSIKNSITANKAWLALTPITVTYAVLIAFTELVQYVPRDSYL